MLDLSTGFAVAIMGQLPASFEARVNTLGCGALGGLADRAGDADAVRQLLLGAELAQPSIVARRQRLPGREAGAAVLDVQLRRLLRLITTCRTGDDAGHDALLRHVVAVLQGERILPAERHRLADGGAELALLLGGIDAGFDCGLVPDRPGTGGGDCRPRRS